MHSDLVLHERERDALVAHLLRGDQRERAAYVLCGEARIDKDPWNGTNASRLIVHEVIPVPDEDVLVSSRDRISWSTASFVELLRRAEVEAWTVGIAHNHVDAIEFSEQDDRNEPELLRLARNRNGEHSRLLSVLLKENGDISSRVWLETAQPKPIRRTLIVGDRLELLGGGDKLEMKTVAFDRQTRLFGPALGTVLRDLRVGIVGCGGTGSAVAGLLARLGVGRLLLVDKDIIDETNLNRLHGATWQHAEQGLSKTAVLANWVKQVGLGTRVAAIEEWVTAEECRDALRSCDLVFGCTDDHDGRLFLNRLAYFYHLPLIDIGLAIEADDSTPPRIQCLDGRISVVLGGQPCLLCRKVIEGERARAEALRRINPEEFDRRKEEAYVIGEGDPAPAVVTFTTEVATLAVNELLQRVQGYRGEDESCAHLVRKFNLGVDIRPELKSDGHCGICMRPEYWGRGDVAPFLDRL